MYCIPTKNELRVHKIRCPARTPYRTDHLPNQAAMVAGLTPLASSRPTKDPSRPAERRLHPDQDSPVSAPDLPDRPSDFENKTPLMENPSRPPMPFLRSAITRLLQRRQEPAMGKTYLFAEKSIDNAKVARRCCQLPCRRRRLPQVRRNPPLTHAVITSRQRLLPSSRATRRQVRLKTHRNKPLPARPRR
ncbi:hypothetical protein ACLOJK_012537 [Asimina triloba]